MNRITKIATGLVLGLGAALPGTAEAGWGAWYKPNLKIAQIGPSSVSPYYARVILTNTGPWSAGSCYVRLQVMTYPTPTYKYYKIPSMAAYSGLGVDIYTGVYMQSPGLVTYGYVDALNQVPESNENDNTKTYIAPPW